jgi:hypothetical protein
MSSNSAFPLDGSDNYTGDNSEGSANAGGGVNDAAGAAGSSPYNGGISQGALIAIIVVVSVVGVLGSMSTPSIVLIHTFAHYI